MIISHTEPLGRPKPEIFPRLQPPDAAAPTEPEEAVGKLEAAEAPAPLPLLALVPVGRLPRSQNPFMHVPRVPSGMPQAVPSLLPAQEPKFELAGEPEFAGVFVVFIVFVGKPADGLVTQQTCPIQVPEI